MYKLSGDELERLKSGILAAYGIPFIDDIEDFIWEAIFAYTRNIPIVDPLQEIRRKKLFDLVDNSNGIGWSAKAIQTNVKPGGNFEVVIQRSNIFKKAQELGFGSLSINSNPELLGKALIRHWVDFKIKRDMEAQGVSDARVCILLKSKDRKTYTFLEQSIDQVSVSDIEWRWTDDTKSGLQGWNGDQLKYRWYHGQTQFFETFKVPDDALIINLNPKRVPLPRLIDILNQELLKINK